MTVHRVGLGLHRAFVAGVRVRSFHHIPSLWCFFFTRCRFVLLVAPMIARDFASSLCSVVFFVYFVLRVIYSISRSSVVLPVDNIKESTGR